MLLDPSFLDAIKGFEGYSPKAAWDYKQSSSGYGTKAQPGDENIPPDQLKAIHEQRFLDEVGKAASAVDSFAPNLPSGVRAALTSLTYNAGPGWQNSGLGQAVKSGDFDTAKNIFLQYNKAGGEVNPGLIKRRTAEAAWFGGGAPAMAMAQPSPQATAAPGPVQMAGAFGPPTFAAPPQQAPVASEAPSFDLSQIPMAQAPQIMFAQPKKRIALPNFRAPTFARG